MNIVANLFFLKVQYTYNCLKNIVKFNVSTLLCSMNNLEVISSIFYF